MLGRTTINLAPADAKREGPSFDLPIAIGILAVNEQIVAPNLDKFAIVGEFALSGEVRSVNGVLPIAICARDRRSAGSLVRPTMRPKRRWCRGSMFFPPGTCATSRNSSRAKRVAPAPGRSIAISSNSAVTMSTSSMTGRKPCGIIKKP